LAESTGKAEEYRGGSSTPCVTLNAKSLTQNDPEHFNLLTGKPSRNDREGFCLKESTFESRASVLLLSVPRYAS